MKLPLTNFKNNLCIQLLGETTEVLRTSKANLNKELPPHNTRQGNLLKFGDIFGCHGYSRDATGILWVEARGATKHTIHRTAFTTKNHLALGVP